MQKRYFLLGLMGCGKTWWGQRLAQRLNLPFVDLDEQIEAGEGMTVSQIFTQMGEKGFRSLEQVYLRRLAVIPEAAVAAGGGAPCFFDNMTWMNAHGITIYLETPVSLLADRLEANPSDRPLLTGTPAGRLLQRLEELLQQREPFYRQAHITVKQSGDEDLVSLIIDKIMAFQTLDSG